VIPELPPTNVRHIASAIEIPTRLCIDGEHRRCRGGLKRRDVAQVYWRHKTNEWVSFETGPCPCECHNGWPLQKDGRQGKLLRAQTGYLRADAVRAFQ
jgi:hypothetical protein